MYAVRKYDYCPTMRNSPGRRGRQATAGGSWQNWAGTATATPARWCRPRTEAEISAAVKDAAAAGLRVRALGSGHSFTPVAATDGMALDLSGWTGIVAADARTGVVTVRSGTTLRALNAALDGLGLAMANLGDIDAQTLAGALSTGTHGTGARLGGLATQVEAFGLVLADGSLATCSASERPELFAAARVGLGALGVISTVTLRCVPAFRLAADERPELVDEVIDRFDSLAAANDHFEFYWFPYGRYALVKRNNRLTPGHTAARNVPASRPLPGWRRFWEFEVMENAGFGALCRLGRAAPRLIPSLNRFSSAALSTRSYTDASYRVFVTPRRVRFVESEYAVPRESLGGVLAELRRAVPRLADPVMFPVEVRVAAADDIWLSTAYGRDTAYIAIHQYVGLPYQAYFGSFESIVAGVAGRPHWGKMHSLDAEQLRALYPRFDDFRRVRAEVDPESRFGNSYLDRVLGQSLPTDDEPARTRTARDRPSVIRLAASAAADVEDHGLPVISAVTDSPLITAFFHGSGRGAGRVDERVVAMRGTVEGFGPALAANGLAVMAGLIRPGGPAPGLRLAANTMSQVPGVGSDVSRIALVTIAVAAVAAFTVLQVIARSRGRRDGGPPPWPWLPGRGACWRRRCWNGSRPTGSPKSRGGPTPATRRCPITSGTTQAGRSGPPRSSRRTTLAQARRMTVRERSPSAGCGTTPAARSSSSRPALAWSQAGRMTFSSPCRPGPGPGRYPAAPWPRCCQSCPPGVPSGGSATVSCPTPSAATSARHRRWKNASWPPGQARSAGCCWLNPWGPGRSRPSPTRSRALSNGPQATRTGFPSG